MNSTNVNIAEILQRQGERLGAKPALIHGSRSITYAELARNVRRRAAWFRSKGIGPGDGIMVVVPMSIELYEIMIAIFHVGGVAVFLDAWSDRARIEHARRSMSIVGFIAPVRAHLLRLLSSPLRSIPTSFRTGIPRGFREEMKEPIRLEGDARALVTFTTGSTGRPRGADRTHRHLREQHRAIREAFGPIESDVDLATLPIFPLSNLATGSTTVLPDIDFRRPSEFDPERMIGTLAAERVTTAALSPAVLERLTGDRRTLTLPDLRRLLVGGATISPELAGRVRRFLPGPDLLAVYGSTEAEPISLISFDELASAADRDWRAGLPAGLPFSGIEVRIVNTARAGNGGPVLLPSGTAGEICVSGPHVLRAYVDRRAEDLEDDRYIMIDGRRWLRTGDAGRLDDGGELHLLGRYSRRIERPGYETLWPGPVELLLGRIEGVGCGTAIEVGGEIRYVVEPTSPEIRDDEVERRVRERVERENLPPGAIAVVGKIERDRRHASKIDYTRLADRMKE